MADTDREKWFWDTVRQADAARHAWRIEQSRRERMEDCPMAAIAQCDGECEECAWLPRPEPPPDIDMTGPHYKSVCACGRAEVTAYPCEGWNCSYCREEQREERAKGER